MIYAYLRYLLKAKNAHGIHSPFVFELYNYLIKHAKPLKIKEVSDYKHSLLTSQQTFKFVDFGAGGLKSQGSDRKIAEVARRSSKKDRYAAFVAQLAQYISAKNIVELGTCLGVSTAYMAFQNPEATIHSFEGDPTLAEIATDFFKKNNLNNIVVYVGNIDHTLAPALSSIESVDLAFIDANHRLEPTLSYFEQLKTKIHDGSALIFDDIYWSKEMQTAWQTIKADPEVSVSIDIFEMGVVFFRKHQAKEHFTLRY